MRSGVCSQRPTLVPLIDDNGSGSWLTPKAQDGMAGNGMRSTQDGRQNEAGKLKAQVRMWGTPVARDDQKSPKAHTVQVKMWPTPRAHDGTSGGDKPSSHPNSGAEGLQTAASRHAQTTSTDGPTGSPEADLNPRFVAALMGVPPDWLTPSTSEATDSCPPQPQKPSPNSSTGSE